MLDRSRGCASARRVSVEAEGYPFEAEAGQTFERLGAGRGASESGDVLDAVSPELVNVEEALDEHELTPR
jgi:hypothetical protein